MKKIVSKYQQKKTERSKQILVSAVLIGILFISIIGFGFQDTSEGKEGLKYNGLEFIETNGYWLTDTQDVTFVFKYNPKQVEDIASDINQLDNYYDKPLYINSKNGEAASEIYVNLDQFVKRIQQACLEEECLYENAPIKTCEDNFIIIQESNETSITQYQNCVYIKGPQEELIKLTDRSLFDIFGII